MTYLALAKGIDLADGCTEHAVTAERIAARWLVARQQDTAVSVCLCCFGPATTKFIEVAGGGYIGVTVWCDQCESTTR